ncbi:glycogenin [Capsaspora owczarzaki ATCC 30864]|uniref:glycogenin glucosyltransferase n=1 Tax=Capsaspora owczarzaki (strain ATCC 30864) TaxID=595528 RepID=A0A0D2U3W0_CAPO3|nr:glycogenin [Capsaspora owczarzaki ATCC 30864]KJE89886.1 glycogenin [Capsaspora owczarzaki ATCC 30864]|eukprot:XP_004349815.2 glycogenin [Capsaspora owczarzaki ATCC 30864]
MSEAFVTLVTNDGYALGALVLAKSLRDVNTTRKIAVLITNEVSEPTRNRLREAFDVVSLVNELNTHDAANLALLGRPELGVTLTKIYAWKLTQFTKCVFLDADTLVVQNVDELFDRPEIAAAPDVGWPDCFNSGVFVFVPSAATFEKLAEHAVSTGSFDGGDQGLLNTFFDYWPTAGPEHRLSFLYNMNANQSYSYKPAFQKYGHLVKIIHFIGQFKPWHWARTSSGRVYAQTQEAPTHSEFHVQQWWNVFDRHYSTSAPPVSLAALPIGFSGNVMRIQHGEALPPRTAPSGPQYLADYGRSGSSPAPAKQYDFSNILHRLDVLIPDKFHATGEAGKAPQSPVYSSQATEQLQEISATASKLHSQIAELESGIQAGRYANPSLASAVHQEVNTAVNELAEKLRSSSTK